MKKSLFVLVSTLTVLCLCFSLTAFAETAPLEDIVPTEDVFATEEVTDYIEDPVYTEVPTDPYFPSEPADITDSTDIYDTTPSDYTEPFSSETTDVSDTAPVTEATDATIHTNPPAPTDPDEDSTFSDYVSPAPVYTPADQDFSKKDWQEIQLDLKSDPAPGKQSFASIQNDNSKGNDSIAGFLIGGLALIFVSIAGFTFAILYNPFKKKKAPAKAGARYSGSPSRENRRREDNRPTFNPDDYNDGF